MSRIVDMPSSNCLGSMHWHCLLGVVAVAWVVIWAWSDLFCSTYNSYAELEADYVAQRLHPKDLKAAITKTINECVALMHLS